MFHRLPTACVHEEAFSDRDWGHQKKISGVKNGYFQRQPAYCINLDFVQYNLAAAVSVVPDNSISGNFPLLA
jgi:hypothetical protein